VGNWKNSLEGRIPDAWAREIDIFETQMELRKQGKIDEKVFAETRLRRGAYGQRYDNGQRHDGVATQKLPFPSGELTKGPTTLWDAPGMQRIKIPWGGLTTEQMDALAQVAEEYSDGILHVTTRQDVQLHFVHIEDTPSIMRRLAAVGITTREACGNTVRNVTACPYSGVCADEGFDVTPYADAMWRFLLAHPDTQDFGRKFKVAFSGCAEHACAVTSIHDIGLIAATRTENGVTQRGFQFFIGGGLGSVPQQAKLMEAFVPEAELLPLAQAVCRVFARLGEKKNRQRARLKFLITRLGFDEVKRLVLAERATLPPDPRWTAFLEGLRDQKTDRPIRPSGVRAQPGADPAYERFLASNVRPQRQSGYAVVHVRLPLGDLTSGQMRALARIATRFTGDSVRTTVDQNIVFRWVSEADLPALYAALQPLGLHTAGAGEMEDITACPGTDTCKLGISSSRGLAAQLAGHLRPQPQGQAGKPGQPAPMDPAVRALHIKTSGCFNACGQHHVADLGFLGVSRNVRGRRVPHFQVVLGGQWSHNGGAFGLALGAVPSRRIPDLVDRVTGRFVKERQHGESFQAFCRRVGKVEIKKMIDDLVQVPSYEEDPSYYSDWGDPREYTIGDMGVGECAGEVVSLTEFGIADAEREVFEAQLLLDKSEVEEASVRAYQAMLSAARALIRVQLLDVAKDAETIVREFRSRLVDTKLFHDEFAGDKFAQYLFRVHGQPFEALSHDDAHQRIEEAQLFIDAAHGCYERMSQAQVQAPV
jgi:sulfite reductase (ferredoxin)